MHTADTDKDQHVTIISKAPREGRFPLWLNPRQIRILTVADRHEEYAKELNNKFRVAGFESELDQSNESVGKKVRSAQMDQVNYILTVGDQEVENKTINVRTRDNIVHGELSPDEFLTTIIREMSERLSESPLSEKNLV